MCSSHQLKFGLFEMLVFTTEIKTCSLTSCSRTRTCCRSRWLLVEVRRAELRSCCIWTRWWGGWTVLTMRLQTHIDMLDLKEHRTTPIRNWRGTRRAFCRFLIKFLFLPIFLSIPAAPLAKLGTKLEGVGSELWHISSLYTLFVLK